MLSRNELKHLARLHQKKFRLEDGKFLVEGPRPIVEALRSDWHVERLIITRPFLANPLAASLLNDARENEVPVAEIPQAEFRHLSTTVTSQGIIAVVREKSAVPDPIDIMTQQVKGLFVAIEKLQDPGNLGTIIRTAEWLGSDAVILGEECVDWRNPKALRASMGASFHIPIFEIDFLPFLAAAKRVGARVYAADQRGDFPYTTLRYTGRKILMLGEETRGISDAAGKLADHRVVIPRRGRGESLNVAIAAAILIAEMAK